MCLNCPWTREGENARLSVYYAAMSMDPRIMKQILPSDHINEGVAGIYPLEYLVKHATNDNMEDAYACIELLVTHNALVFFFKKSYHVEGNKNLNEDNKQKILCLIGEYNEYVKENCQALVKYALDKKDLVAFAKCIHVGGHDMIYDDNVSIFKKVLSTHGCCDFVEVFEKFGRIYAPYCLHYGVKSMDPKIIKLLLPNKYLALLLPNKYIDEKTDGLTPLCYLAKHIEDCNVDDAFECIKLLLNHKAVQDTVDEQGLSPLAHILQNEKLNRNNKKLIIEEFIRCDPVNDNVLRSKLEIEFDILEFPARKRLELFEAIEYGQNERFSKLLTAAGTDYNDAGAAGDTGALDYAIMCVNSYALEALLRKGDAKFFSSQPILFNLIHSFETKVSIQFAELQKCLHLLLETFKRVKINDYREIRIILDRIHYRLADDVTLELLKSGLCLGAINKVWAIYVSNISASVLKRFFDYRIYDGVNIYKTISYSNFISPYNYDEPENNPQSSTMEMQIIEHIADSEEKKHLIEHPYIEAFLRVKWAQLSPLFHLNLWLYIFFAVSCVTYILLKFNSNELWSNVFRSLTWLGMIYLIIRECLQIILIGMRNYWRSASNYTEWIMIILTTIVTFEPDFGLYMEKVIATVIIIFVTINLFQFLGSLPYWSMSKRMHMFTVVLGNFLKSFLLYSVFVLAFSLCFYIMIGTEVDRNVSRAPTNGAEVDANGDLNNFSNLWNAFLKSMVMMTGELDANSLRLKDFGYGLFFLFLFVVTIVLYNLINGIAISDILEIENKAKMNDVNQRIKLISRHDTILRNNWTFLECILKSIKCRWFQLILLPHYVENINIDTKCLTSITKDDPTITFYKSNATCHMSPLMPKDGTELHLYGITKRIWINAKTRRNMNIIQKERNKELKKGHEQEQEKKRVKEQYNKTDPVTNELIPILSELKALRNNAESTTSELQILSGEVKALRDILSKVKAKPPE